MSSVIKASVVERGPCASPYLTTDVSYFQCSKNIVVSGYRHISANHGDQRDQGEHQGEQGLHTDSTGSANARIDAVMANEAIMVFSMPIFPLYGAEEAPTGPPVQMTKPDRRRDPMTKAVTSPARPVPPGDRHVRAVEQPLRSIVFRPEPGESAVDLRGKGPKIAIAAACLAGSVSTGLLASAYTTAGMDPRYTQQYDVADTYEAPHIVYADPAPARFELADSGSTDTPTYPPIPTSR
jgi:hypothetical protein